MKLTLRPRGLQKRLRSKKKTTLYSRNTPSKENNIKKDT